MLKKNSSYLSFGLEDWPFALFAHAGAGMRDQTVLSRVQNKKNFHANLDEGDIGSLRWRPHLTADLILHNRLTPSEVNAIFGSNFPLIFRVLMRDYERLAPHLEQLLFSDLESVERLASFFVMERKAGLRPMEFYAELLEADPNRALNVIPEENTRAFKRDMLASSAPSMCCTSPGWAFFYLRSRRDESIAAEVKDVLLKSDEYSYYAARLMRDRHVVSANYADLLQNLKDPRWIYHTLRDGLGGDTEALLQSLFDHPAWLVQYLHSARMGIEQKEEIYTRAVAHLAKSGAHVALQNDLHVWFQMSAVNEVLSAMRQHAA